MKDSIVVRIFGWTLTIVGVYVLITLYNCYATDVFITTIRTSIYEAPIASLSFGVVIILLAIFIYNTANYSLFSSSTFVKIVMKFSSFYFLVFGLLFVNSWHLNVSYASMRNIYSLPPICYVWTAICFLMPGLILLFYKKEEQKNINIESK